MCADKILECGDRDENARAFTMLDDPCDVPIVVEEIVSVASFQMLRTCGPIIHQDVVRRLHVVAGKKNKSACHFAEGFGVDAVNHLHSTGGIELQQYGCDGLNIFKLPYF